MFMTSWHGVTHHASVRWEHIETESTIIWRGDYEVKNPAVLLFLHLHICWVSLHGVQIPDQLFQQRSHLNLVKKTKQNWPNVMNQSTILHKTDFKKKNKCTFSTSCKRNIWLGGYHLRTPKTSSLMRWPERDERLRILHVSCYFKEDFSHSPNEVPSLVVLVSVEF